MYKKLLAEFIGTFILVFCGTGAIIINQETNGSITHSGIAITFGLVVTILIYTFGSISGAHFNPAVSISLTINKSFESKNLIPYIIAQISGAFLASFILKTMFTTNKFLGSTLPNGSDMQSFILEMILTFILMLVIFQTAVAKNENNKYAGFLIGFVVLLEAMFAGPICGASMNPARSLGPAIASMELSKIYIYIFAPILGAILSIPIYKILNK